MRRPRRSLFTKDLNGLALVTAMGLVFAGTTANAGSEAPADETIPTLGSCRFHLPESASTIVYQASSGSLQSDFHIPHSIKRVGRQEIVVPNETAPVFIVLAGFESIEWSLRVQPNAKIAGVYVLGLADQVITGVPAGVRIGFSVRRIGDTAEMTSDEGQGCPSLKARNVALSDLRSIETLLSEEFGRQIDKAHVAHPLPCPYRECLLLAKGGRSWWQRLFGETRAASTAHAPDVRASGRFIVRNDAL
ncbi:hypothetical protein QMZ05_18710 [Bradyrhizobium sp. INPA03-11B]|uniref:hypothetical protein n=1 Tax=Bradyrhizobium sp. INPA03-11B TaxID=418598 RepID=UPI0033903288